EAPLRTGDVSSFNDASKGTGARGADATREDVSGNVCRSRRKPAAGTEIAGGVDGCGKERALEYSITAGNGIGGVHVEPGHALTGGEVTGNVHSAAGGFYGDVFGWGLLSLAQDTAQQKC